MGRYLSILRGGQAITHKTGSTTTFDSGATLVMNGTLTLAAVNLTATGNFATTGTLTAGSSLAVTTTSVLAGNVTIGDGYAGTGSTLTAAGAASFKGALVVAGASTLTGAVGTGALTVTGAATVSTTLGVTGLATLTAGFKTAAGVEGGTTAGTVWSSGAPAFIAAQGYITCQIHDGTVVRIPYWANA
jgi:fibronectin-binding autotransporter adhesin